MGPVIPVMVKIAVHARQIAAAREANIATAARVRRRYAVTGLLIRVKIAIRPRAAPRPMAGAVTIATGAVIGPPPMGQAAETGSVMPLMVKIARPAHQIVIIPTRIRNA